jgi:hypothetical protein
MHDGYIACHTVLVLWRARMCLPEYFKDLNSEEQNITMWACLMHDLKKLGTPFVEGKDHVHPFKSAVAVLEVFKKLGVLQVETKEQIHSYIQVCRLISESVQPVPHNCRHGP